MDSISLAPLVGLLTAIVGLLGACIGLINVLITLKKGSSVTRSSLIHAKSAKTWSLVLLASIGGIIFTIFLLSDMSDVRCKASSYQSDYAYCVHCACQKAFDNNTHTRWASNWRNEEWIERDFGAKKTFDTIVLQWENAFATRYVLETSNDDGIWTTVYRQEHGKGGIETIRLPLTTTRYIRMRGIARGTPYGYSLWEFEVFREAAQV
jgi:hypothetical protein